MRSLAKGVTTLLACSLLLVVIIGTSAERDGLAASGAPETNRLMMAPGSITEEPINSAWAAYQQRAAVASSGRQVGSASDMEIAPSIVNFSATTQPAPSALAYAATYDLRTLGKVSPVGQQAVTERTCWTFATMGSLESYLLPKQSWIFSKRHLENLHGFNPGCPYSGTNLISTAYFARWGGTTASGPVKATCNPYTQSSCTSPYCPAAQHVQRVLFLPYRTGSLGNNDIKWALQHYGGVYAAIYMHNMSQMYYGNAVNNPYFKPANAAYYYTGDHAKNHLVTIVGWNDSYPASKFAIRPPGPGAFIVKNSWGTSWGDKGFFYVSYYDTQLARNTQPPTVFTSQSTTNYKTNYQYDPFGWVSNLGAGTTTAWGANVFTAKTGNLTAVSFYARAPQTRYTIQVYKDPVGSPTKGTLVATTSGNVTYAGYYTISLGKKIPLTSGHKFSVVVKFTTPGSNYPVPIEKRVLDYTNNATNGAGQSYFSSSGTSWTDVYTLNNNQDRINVCIKAFAGA